MRNLHEQHSVTKNCSDFSLFEKIFCSLFILRGNVRCQMSKLVLNVKYLLWLSFLTAAEFYNLAHIRVHYSKEIIFSNLGYFQICFSCRLKNSKQTFKTKFVIRQWQWNESDISESLYPRGLSHSVPKTIKVSFVFYLHFHM